MEESGSGVGKNIQDAGQMNNFGAVMLDSEVPTLNHQISGCFTVTHGFVVDN